jgi:ferrous iron transport protein B
MSKRIKVALIGNPNTGKSSVFNLLTGLQQKTGNYPGITVEKKEGFCRLTKELSATIFDLPGTYSLNASSLDENVVIELLMNRKHEDFPDVAVIVADIENIKRNLLLFTQIKDLGIPSILVVNMSDRMRRKGISLDVETMEQELNTKIVLTSTLKKEGIDTLKTQIANYVQLENSSCLDFRDIDPDYFASLQKTFPNQ